MLNNVGIKVLNVEHGKKVIEWFQSQDIDTGSSIGSIIGSIYGVFDGQFDCNDEEIVKSRFPEFNIITLPEELPKDWYIEVTKENSEELNAWRKSVAKDCKRITVNYGNFACNTESDITIIIFPNLPEYNTDVAQLNVLDNNGVQIPSIIRNKFNIDLSNYLSARDFHQFEIGIIQCKTNWNDNAQVPMLWDMIYSAGGFRGRNITLGRNGYNIQNAQSFTYSFVTVPSNQNTVYKPDGVAVKRVTNLSGGNYWGQPTVQNVAKSLKEIFTNNFQSGSRTTLRTDIRAAIPHLTGNNPLSYFGL